MLNKLYDFITKTQKYKDYAARRVLLDTTMMTITHEYVKTLTSDSQDLIDDFHKLAIEATDTRNDFCNRHKLYTYVFDYTFKKGLK